MPFAVRLIVVANQATRENRAAANTVRPGHAEAGGDFGVEWPGTRFRRFIGWEIGVLLGSNLPCPLQNN